ncbi:hypothetical protein CDL15_Pgr003051 [Punica granatum]|uniref:peptidylprolyl isomerase n=1 Tax=Punica granatum TaxID=22663 RepID=A0A218X2J4_PUNGR|nr:hypothetical protein CDL15_Pgr003051 [Punica granatum]
MQAKRTSKQYQASSSLGFGMKVLVFHVHYSKRRKGSHQAAVSDRAGIRMSKAQVENYGFCERTIGTDGLRKQILRKGNSWQTPFHGDEVEVHFSGQIEGGAFLDSSRNGSSFKFKLGQCEVIRGWDEGVAMMKKGERAIFTIPPNLAYGELGFPPLIPPDSTLVYDIEMISWSSIRDLTGDGGVLKKIVKEGVGWATPRDGDEVVVKYEARLEDGTVVSKSEEGVEFQLGDGYLCPAMSIAAKTMRRNEKAELSVKFSYGFGYVEDGPTDVERTTSASSNLSIELELLSWKSVIEVMGDKKVLKRIIKAGEGFERPKEGSVIKVAYISKHKDGTVIERRGTMEEPFEFVSLEEQINESLERAIMTMKKGERSIVTVSTSSVVHYEVDLIDFTKEKPFWKMDSREKIEACERNKSIGNSLFKAGNFWQASKKYEKVLEIDPSNAKALYRRSQAYLNVSDLEKAEADISRALSIHPNDSSEAFNLCKFFLFVCFGIDRDLKLVYKELKEKQREYKVYQAEMSRTILSRMV